MHGHLSSVSAQIDHLNKSRSRYEVPSEYTLDWTMFAVSDGNILVKEKLENEYTTLEVLKLMYFKQVKTLKELEAMER